MRNPLQDRLLKAGLVKKGKLDQVVREQARQHHGKAPPPPDAGQVEALRLQAQRAERDRALAAEQKEQLRTNELRAQIRQIVESHKVQRSGESPYRFTDEGKISTVLVNEMLRKRLANGVLVIVRHDQGYELLPRDAAEKVRTRDASLIALDHGATAASPAASSVDDEYYKQFEVPDDLIW